MISILSTGLFDTQQKLRLARGSPAHINIPILKIINMHYSGIFVAFTALSSFAAALPRPHLVTPPKAVPIKFDALHSTRSVDGNAGVITRRAIDSGAKILRPIKVHPSFTKRSDDEDPNSIDFSRLDLSKQAQLIYGSPDCKMTPVMRE